MLRGFLRPVLGLGLTAVVAAGCTAEVRGAPDTGPASTRVLANTERITAKDALGELTLWNPCSVVLEDELPDEWFITMHMPAAFEYCSMEVTTEGDTRGNVWVGYLFKSTHDLGKYESGKRPGGITVVPVDGDRICTRDIVFADGIAIEVRAEPAYEEDLDAMCEVSDTVADQVIDAVKAGRAETLELPENSLGALDPCEVVQPAMLAGVPGLLPGVRPEGQVNQHSCWWRSPDFATMVNVNFSLGHMPAGNSGQMSHDRYTAVSRHRDDSTHSLCSVDGEHVPFEHWADGALMERVGITVYLRPGQGEVACAVASSMANVLWPVLPPRV